MITDARGNLLDDPADALVNTVNTVGVMGKGIALQFKRRFPAMFKEYERAAKRGELHLGSMHVWRTGTLEPPYYVINFPTKGHWRSRSKVADIQAGLDDLRSVLAELQVTSVAVPPLGCGHGGLRWDQVEPMIGSALGDLPGIEVRVYPPEGAPPASEMVDNTTRPSMSHGKATLLVLLDRYLSQAFEVTQLEIQKLLYFLQEAGEGMNLAFVKDRYGPYADDARKSLRSMEGHFIRGFGDGSSPVLTADPIDLMPGAVKEASTELAATPETLERIGRVLDLTQGFASPYGLELLSTVHWIATRIDPAAAHDPEVAASHVADWNHRKARLFTQDHVASACQHLVAKGWLPE